MEPGDNRCFRRARDLRHVLNGEWITDILLTLRAGSLHYQQLFAALQDLSGVDPWTGTERRIQGSVLSRTLRRLEDWRLVLRNEESGVFPRSVLYSLTPAGADLLASARPLMDWADEHPDLIEHMQAVQAERRRRATTGQRPEAPNDVDG